MIRFRFYKSSLKQLRPFLTNTLFLGAANSRSDNPDINENILSSWKGGFKDAAFHIVAMDLWVDWVQDISLAKDDVGTDGGSAHLSYECFGLLGLRHLKQKVVICGEQVVLFWKLR